MEHKGPRMKLTEELDSLVDIGLAITSDSGEVIQCNQAFASLVIDSKSNIIGRSIVSLVSTDQQSEVRKALVNLQSGAEPSIRSFRCYVQQNGSVAPRIEHLIFISETRQVVAFVYPDAEANQTRLLQLEEMLAKCLTALGGGTTITVGDTINADRGANVSNGFKGGVWIAIVIGAILAGVIGAIAVSRGGSAQYGPGGIEIKGGGDDPAPVD